MKKFFKEVFKPFKFIGQMIGEAFVSAYKLVRDVVAPWIWERLLKPAGEWLDKALLPIADFFRGLPTLGQVLVTGMLVGGIFFTGSMILNLFSVEDSAGVETPEATAATVRCGLFNIGKCTVTPQPSATFTLTPEATLTNTIVPSNTPTDTPTTTATNTKVPTATKLVCFELLGPGDGAALNSTGLLTLNWETQPNAASYFVVLIGPDGDALFKKTIQDTSYEQYLASLPAGGRYSWFVLAQDADGQIICETELSYFDKPAFVPTETPIPTKKPGNDKGGGGSGGDTAPADTPVPTSSGSGG